MRSDVKDCNPAYKPGEGPNLSLCQLKVSFLDEKDKECHQPITGTVMYLERHPLRR